MRTRIHNGIEYAISEAHPAADAFPWVTPDEIEALAADIKANGLADEILRLPDTRIIDGRNRELACLVAGVKPRYVTEDLDEDRILAIVISRNIHRRNLTVSQRAMIAAELANMQRGAQIRTGADLNSQENAAKTMDVSERSVNSAVAVKTKAPELVDAVKGGKLDVKTAEKVAKLPKKSRKKVAKAKDPKKAAKEELAKAKAESKVTPPQPTDGWGIPIQPHAAEAFAAVSKFKELVSAIQAAQKLFNEVANLPGGKFLTLPDVSSYRRGKKNEDGTHADRFVHEGLERACQQVKNATPAHTVCPYQYAETAHPEDCPCCRGLNWTPALGDNIPASCVERARKELGAKEVA